MLAGSMVFASSFFGPRRKFRRKDAETQSSAEKVLEGFADPVAISFYFTYRSSFFLCASLRLSVSASKKTSGVRAAQRNQLENGIARLDNSDMSTLQEIEQAAASLGPNEQRELVKRLVLRLRDSTKFSQGGHSVLDIPSFSVGKIIDAELSDDRLGEMLEPEA